MGNGSKELLSSEKVFADQYRGLQIAISNMTGEPEPPCYFCTDQQIWICSKTRYECATFSRFYSLED